MSKSLGNYVALTDPAAEQFGKLMSIPDTLVRDYAQLCTNMAEEQIRALSVSADQGGPGAAQAKRAVARAVVAIYHGQHEADRAEHDFNLRFRDRAVPQDVPTVQLPNDPDIYLPALLSDAGLSPSRAAARRLIDAGAVRLNGEPLSSGTYTSSREALAGRVVQAGRRRAARLLG